MLSTETSRPVVDEMRRAGRSLQLPARPNFFSPKTSPRTIGAPRSGSAASGPASSEGPGRAEQLVGTAAIGLGKANKPSPAGAYDEALLHLASHVEQRAAKSGALQIQSHALTALVEGVKDACAVVLLPALKSNAPELLAASGGMNALFASNSNNGQRGSSVDGFLLACRQARERGEEQAQWRACDGMDRKLSVTTTARLPGCEVVLVHATPVAVDQGTIGQCVESGRAQGLTRRQVEILELLACGLGNREIAHRLGISYHTARAHLRDIYFKLSVSNRIEAINAVRWPAAKV